ncbi:hypothetical protein GGF46_005205 [Coemansia sp. RSA 552]|nr:hypothetical protein GGF46_005205 [Coemansia sp. RSA 552]
MRPNPGNRSLSPSPSSAGDKKAEGGATLSYAATAARKGAAAGNGRRGSGRQASSSPAALPLTSLVNTVVRVDLVDGRQIEGVLFTYDVYSGVVALVAGQGGAQQGAAKREYGVHLVKAANIKDVRVVGGDSGIAVPEIRPVAPGEVEGRKQRALVQAQGRAARIGVGVSDQAQTIFEALAKTLPCRWDGARIIVLDEVLIEPPYVAESCRELTPDAFSLLRVKKVLQGELSRLEQTAASG